MDSAKEMAAARRDSAKEAASARRDVAGVGGGGVALSDDARDAFARQFHATGRMPVGRGINPAMTRSIFNRAAELYPNDDLAGNAGSYIADVGSLKKLQTQSDVMNSFESTALKNLNQFLDQAHSVVDTGSPLFNAPARKFQQAVAGDPKMTGFNVARQVAVQEISKVLGGATGNAAVSDSARHEVEGLIGPDASLAQIEMASKILTQDMANRHGAVNAQLQEIKGRISGKPQATPASAPATPDAAALRKKYKL